MCNYLKKTLVIFNKQDKFAQENISPGGSLNRHGSSEVFVKVGYHIIRSSSLLIFSDQRN